MFYLLSDMRILSVLFLAGAIVGFTAAAVRTLVAFL